MELLDRNSTLLETPIRTTLHEEIDEVLLAKLRNFMERRDLQVLSAPQVGVANRLIVGRMDGNVHTMINPRIADYEEEDYIYLKVPPLHSESDYTCRYHNSIILEWEWWGATKYTERCEMYGVQAALYQHALGFLDGQPPWKYIKLVDW